MGNVKRNKRGDLEGEVWFSCPNFPGYEASNLGYVQYPSGHRTLGGVVKSKGYRYCAPSYKKSSYQRCGSAVHILVADAFFPEDCCRPFVNHKNRDRQDNCIENLERVSASENSRHAWNTPPFGFKLVRK